MTKKAAPITSLTNRNDAIQKASLKNQLQKCSQLTQKIMAKYAEEHPNIIQKLNSNSNTSPNITQLSAYAERSDERQKKYHTLHIVL